MSAGPLLGSGKQEVKRLLCVFDGHLLNYYTALLLLRVVVVVVGGVARMLANDL